MNNTRVSVSLVIPAYNEEHHLKACLDAVAAQTSKPFEVLVVDNNSEDRTAEIARSYPFVQLISESRQGSVFASTAGFNAATGDIIGRIDADTILAADWLAIVQTYFEAHPGTAAITGKCHFRDFPLRRTISAVHAFLYHYAQSVIAGGMVLWGSNMAIRRDVWQAVRDGSQVRPGIDEDIDLSIQLAKSNHTVKRIRSARATVSMLRGGLGPRRVIRYLKNWHYNYTANGQYVRGGIIYVLKMMGFVVILPISALYALLHRE